VGIYSTLHCTIHCSLEYVTSVDLAERFFGPSPNHTPQPQEESNSSVMEGGAAVSGPPNPISAAEGGATESPSHYGEFYWYAIPFPPPLPPHPRI